MNPRTQAHIHRESMRSGTVNCGRVKGCKSGGRVLMERQEMTTWAGTMLIFSFSGPPQSSTPLSLSQLFIPHLLD